MLEPPSFPDKEKTMNRVSQLFKELMDALKQKCEFEEIEKLLAEFAARVAEKGCTCLGINKKYPLIPACLLLSAYSVTLSFHRRRDDVLLIYARPSEHNPNEHRNRIKIRVAKRLLRAR
jgi:hypothetical protein